MLTFAAFPGAAQESSIGTRFIMQEPSGRIVKDEDFRGKFMLIFFGYTFCPDICPTALGTVAEAMNLVGTGESEKLVPIFVTLDPERDTPARLGEFVKHFHPRLVGLTGSPEMLSRLTKAYKVTYQKVPAGKDDPGNYLIDHSAGLYLMDREGKFRAKFLHGTGAEELARRLKEELSR
jgi:protein SCO1/2